MPSLPREDLDKWVEQWLEANRECERKGDWKPLADFYTDDATYGWNIGPKEDVMCVGVDEILWDYVRRPEDKLGVTQVIPGLGKNQSVETAVAAFLGSRGVARHPPPA